MSALRAEGVLHRRRVLICLRATNIELCGTYFRLRIFSRSLKMLTIFFDAFMTQVLSPGTHSGARRQCFIFCMCQIWKKVQIEPLGSTIHPVVDSWEISEKKYTSKYTAHLMVMASRGQKWIFFLPTRFLTKSLDFDTDFDLNECF